MPSNELKYGSEYLLKLPHPISSREGALIIIPILQMGELRLEKINLSKA